MRKVGARSDERRIQLDGPQQPAHRILHPVPFQRLPLMMRAQIELMCFPTLRRSLARNFGHRNCGNGKAAAMDPAAQADHQLTLQLHDSAAFHHQIFAPELRTIRNPDHLSPQPQPLRRCMQLTAENKIRLERLADLMRRHSAPRQCEHRFPSHDRRHRAFGSAQPLHCCLSNRRTKVVGNAVPGVERQDGKPRHRASFLHIIGLDGSGDPVPAFVDALDAIRGLQPFPERFNALRGDLARSVFFAPHGALKLRRAHDLARPREQQTQNRRLHLGERKRRLPAKERPISLEPETGKPIAKKRHVRRCRR